MSRCDCRRAYAPVYAMAFSAKQERLGYLLAWSNVCTVDRSMKSLLPLGMRQLIFPYSLPGSGTPKKCSWQSNVSNRGFSPAVMYHRPCAAHLSHQAHPAAP